MQSPMVSIVMPVYNTAPYLRQAIDSILNQTFTDFEFIIINDGSTDETEVIVSSYSDIRIRYLKNESNYGLVYTLNRGLDHAIGNYIARMDGDDISLPQRLEKQVSYLQSHKEVDVLASVVQLINDEGISIGYWQDDKNNMTPDQLLRFMPINNCIAHPSVMARSEILKQYRYNPRQKQAEDYDLWLRLLADGRIIHKTDEILLLHRILPKSFTRSQRNNIFYKLAGTKFRFFRQRLGKGGLNSFTLRTLFVSMSDSIKGFLKGIKLLVTR